MKPILFKSEMVRAILDGRKTVTRRVVKPQPKENEENPHRIASGSIYFDVPDKTFGGILKSVGPYRPTYRPGDILYVRETFCRQHSEEYPFVYKASVETPAAWIWTPSIHMPRETARIFLRVTDVRVERLQCMAPYDIAFEGFRKQKDFIALWDSTIKSADRALYEWGVNPWVWVIRFERVSREEAVSIG